MASGGHSAQRLIAAGMWAQEGKREREREHVHTKGGRERDRERACTRREREIFFQSKSNVSTLSEHYNLEMAPGGHSVKRLIVAGKCAQEGGRERDRERARTRRLRFSFSLRAPSQHFRTTSTWRWLVGTTAHCGWHAGARGRERKRESMCARGRNRKRQRACAHKEIEIFFQSKSNVSKLSDHYNLEVAPGGHSAQRLNAAGMWAQEGEREREGEHVRT